mgnify:CR=1 FL=1
MRKMLCVAVTSMGILFAGCNSPVFTPIASPNPWQDDYSFLSSMDNYRSWGTYNVHDPSCRKLGDYYYMYSTDAILGENRQEAEEKNVRWDTYKYAVPRTLSMGVCRLGFSGNTAGSCGVGTFTCRR